MNDPMERQMMIGILKSYCTDTLGPEDSGFGEGGFTTMVPSTEVPDETKTTVAAGSAGGLIWSSSMWTMAPVVVTSWLLLGVVGAGRR
jgi:hypothetical protein